MKNAVKLFCTVCAVLTFINIYAGMEKFALENKEAGLNYNFILNDDGSLLFTSSTQDYTEHCQGSFKKEFIETHAYPFLKYDFNLKCTPAKLTLITASFVSGLEGVKDGLIISPSFFGRTIPVKLYPTW